jgi:hypothetical protein
MIICHFKYLYKKVFKLEKMFIVTRDFKGRLFLLRFIMKGNSKLILESKEKLNPLTPCLRLS